jgi:hypothetical protein
MKELGRVCGNVVVRKLQFVKHGAGIVQSQKLPLKDLIAGSRVHLVAPYVRSDMLPRSSELYREIVDSLASITKESQADQVFLVLPMPLAKVLTEIKAQHAKSEQTLHIIVDDSHALTQALARVRAEEAFFNDGELCAFKEIVSRDLPFRISIKMGASVFFGFFILVSIMLSLRSFFKK